MLFSLFSSFLSNNAFNFPQFFSSFFTNFVRFMNLCEKKRLIIHHKITHIHDNILDRFNTVSEGLHFSVFPNIFAPFSPIVFSLHIIEYTWVNLHHKSIHNLSFPTAQDQRSKSRIEFQCFSQYFYTVIANLIGYTYKNEN